MMNKGFYKRIIGLFIFALAFMLLDIINVNADACDDAKDNEKMLARYGLKMEYDETTGDYKLISAFNDKTTGKSEYFKGYDLKKIKFKITGMYFYTPYEPAVKLDDDGYPIKDANGNYILENDASENVSDADNIKEIKAGYVEDVTSKLAGLVNSKVISKSTLSRHDSITIKPGVFYARSDGQKYGLAFKLEPDGFDDPMVVGSCTGKHSFFAIVHIAVENAQEETDAERETDDFEGIDDGNRTEWVDCTQSYPVGSFAYNFCVDKIASVGADGKQKFLGTKKFTIKNYKQGNMIKYEDNNTEIAAGKALEYKCDYTVSQNNSSSSEYYVNKNYLYGEGDVIVDLGTYQYSGEYSAPSSSLNATCKIHCEEVVKVEYGPPVASKAGLCFEYKVKVTSRVNCKSEQGPNKPPKQAVCTPTPYCKHEGGKLWNIAGPNESFDNCVVGCDGGVYSDRCVNKCYKQVYGKSIVRQTTGYEIAYEDVDNAVDVPVISENLHYVYKIKNKAIYWDVNGSTKRKSGKKKYADYGGTNSGGYGWVITDSWWHKKHTWGINSSLYNLYTSNGIPEKVGCKYANCWWKKNTNGLCGKSEVSKYLNSPNVYKGKNRKDGDYSYHDGDKVVYDKYTYDKVQNEKKYKELVRQCKAYAACNTTTSEFTISVEYTEKGKETTTTKINFPYTENNDENSKDAITHNDNDSISCPTNANSIILKSRGCYNCGGAGANITENEGEEGLKKMYMTEWSFPGTWIHNKTGKISYKPITDGTWRKIKEKFCLPLNAGNVNAKWYNYYQYQTKGNDTSYTYYNPDYIKNVECPDGTTVQTKCGSDNIVPTEDDIKYNIKATARKFGLFEWDIDIKCFYAVNDIFPKEKESDTCSLTCGSTEKYRVRSVDLNNLFPDKNGTQLTDTSTTGRTPGFNWSTYANQTNKDVDYTSAPSNYAKWIQFQASNGGIYNDEYLDYEVTLTKEIINDIKQDFKSDRSYISWKGNIVNTDDEASANSYRSPLFEQGGLLAGDSVYPNGEALKCNNIGAHTKSSNYSAVCAEFNNSGKEGK